MRALFLILLLGNLAFYAWDRYLRVPVEVDARIRQVEITPEKIRILDASNAPSTRVPTKAADEEAAKAKPKISAACLEWGSFIGTEIQRAEAAINETGLPAAGVQRVTNELPGHWVLIPPQKTRAEANALVQALKALNIADYSLVQDPPERRNAISLGIFRTEEAAQTLLGALRKKGLDTAVIERREKFFRQAVFYLREPNAGAVAKWNALRAVIPGTEVKAVQCPAT